MAIKDLKIRQGNVDVVVDIVDVGDVREFEKFGRQGRVATAVAKDESGDIKLTLWNEQIDQVKSGDKVHITNGYVSEWQGEPQLTTGKMGKLEIVGESKEVKEEMTSPPDEEKDKNIYEESKKRLEDVEEKLEDEPVSDVEDIKDE
jgi:replication factor A1|tara:strand:- start:613 stop:1050 length:438 start_codon:yes stop_codon:yes gene_type:complete